MTLKGKQKKLDKNNNGRIDAGDFALMKKAGYKMGGGMIYANEGISADSIRAKSERVLKDAQKTLGSDRITGRDIEAADRFNRIRKQGIKARNEALDKALEGKFKDVDRLTPRDIQAASKINRRKGGVMKAYDGAFMDYNRDTLKIDKKKLANEAMKSVERVLSPGTAAIRDLGTLYRKYKNYKIKKKNEKDAEVVEAKKGRMMKANTGDLADTMKKLRKKAYEKSGKKNKNIGRMGEDEYFIQKKLPGMKSGKYVFDMVGVKPMSGLNKDKKKTDGFLDDVFEKTIKRYGLKDPTKKK